MFLFCVQSPVQQKLTAILSPIDRKIASRQNSGVNNFFYRDRIGVWSAYLVYLMFWLAYFWFKAVPFAFPVEKKYAGLKKKYANAAGGVAD